MRIGIISDTHGYLDDQILHYFENCDEIWHAGDIGRLEVAKKLATFKSFKAVHGNIDDMAICTKYPSHQHFICQGLRIWITHIAGKPNAYPPHISKVLRNSPPDILVCGHTHILRIMRDPIYNGVFYFNPGAAGKYGIHTVRTILRFEIKNQKPCNMEVVELGPNTSHI